MITKLIEDKGYLSQSLFEDLFQNGVTLITKIKKNMKNKRMNMSDKMMLMRRFFIETIFSSLKSLGTFVHSRHRSPINALAHILSALIAYQIRPLKPSLSSFIKVP